MLCFQVISLLLCQVQGVFELIQQKLSSSPIKQLLQMIDMLDNFNRAYQDNITNQYASRLNSSNTSPFATNLPTTGNDDDACGGFDESCLPHIYLHELLEHNENGGSWLIVEDKVYEAPQGCRPNTTATKTSK